MAETKPRAQIDYRRLHKSFEIAYMLTFLICTEIVVIITILLQPLIIVGGYSFVYA